MKSRLQLSKTLCNRSVRILAVLRSAILRPLRILVRRTIEAVRHIRHGKLVSQKNSNPRRLIGMTSTDEQRFYEDCVATVANIEGEVVDLGCWMCSTTIPLVKGVRTSAKITNSPVTKVYAFDRFIWENWMNHHMPLLSCHYLSGESFLPEARGLLGDMLLDVELVQADLTNYIWKNGPIRILLVDAMKSANLAQRITECFFPSLVRGTLVIHQDFKHFYAPWIHVLQYRLRDYFRFHCETPTGGTVAFQTLEEIPHDLAASVLQMDDISEDEIDAVFEYSLNLVGIAGKSSVAAAHVMHFVHRGETSVAWHIVERYAKLVHPKQGDFHIAKERLRALP